MRTRPLHPLASPAARDRRARRGLSRHERDLGRAGVGPHDDTRVDRGYGSGDRRRRPADRADRRRRSRGSKERRGSPRPPRRGRICPGRPPPACCDCRGPLGEMGGKVGCAPRTRRSIGAVVDDDGGIEANARLPTPDGRTGREYPSRLMLLTITTTHRAGDRPRLPAAQAPGQGARRSSCASAGARLLPRGDATTRCTAALLLEVDPVGLVRGGAGPRRRASPRPVRQRPALRRLVVPERGASPRSSARRSAGAARSGRSWPTRRSRSRRGSPSLPVPRRRAASCGRCSSRWATRSTPSRHPLDDRVPDWGDSPYFTVDAPRRTAARGRC